MGVSIKYVRERRRKAMLRKAIWNRIEGSLPDEFDIEAANDVTVQLCNVVDTAIEDMMNVAEFNRIGYRKRHWYVLELHINDVGVQVQNTLQGAAFQAPTPAAAEGLYF